MRRKWLTIFLFLMTLSCFTLMFLSCEGWEEEFTGKSESLNEEAACDIVSARGRVGEKDVCVKGSIVGGDLTSSASGISFEAPFSSATHLAIADSLSVNEKSACFSVQLPSGKIRDGLNLVNRPENHGRMVYLKGDIVASYFGIVGMKNVTDFVLK